MELVRVVVVADEEHIAHQSIQTVSYPHIVHAVFTFEDGLNLALRVVFRFQGEDVVVFVVEVFLHHLVGMDAEHTVYDPTGNERSGEQFLLEVQAIAFNFLSRHSERRGELSEQSVNTGGRYSPYTEETEHVVNAVGIKVFRHVLESSYPPFTSVIYHPLPVVGRESPVLSVYGESVRWSARLRVEVEVLRLMPYVTSVAVHSDRNVALENHTTRHGILMSRTHLSVEHKLHIIVERHVGIFLRFRIGEFLAVSLMPLFVSLP